MADSRFFKNTGPFLLSELASLVNAEIINGDPTMQINDVNSLDKASCDQISFFDNKKYLDSFCKSPAGACLVHPDFVDRAPKGMALLVTAQPYMAYAHVASAFYPNELASAEISDRAFIDDSASVGSGCQIEAGAYIGKNVEIGKNTKICANSVIRDGVTIGEDCFIGSNATISHCQIGNKVTIHPGAQIGQEGFGFASGPRGHVRIPQLGRVIIKDGANIGANTTIDRGAGPDTIIGIGVQIDNLVQIGHNVEVGDFSVLVSQSGVSGSTKLGRFCVVAGQVGIAGHLTVGDGAQIGAQSGVMRNIEAGEKVGGTPSVPIKQWLRHHAFLNQMTNSAKKKG